MTVSSHSLGAASFESNSSLDITVFADDSLSLASSQPRDTAKNTARNTKASPASKDSANKNQKKPAGSVLAMNDVVFSDFAAQFGVHSGYVSHSQEAKIENKKTTNEKVEAPVLAKQVAQPKPREIAQEVETSKKSIFKVIRDGSSLHFEPQQIVIDSEGDTTLVLFEDQSADAMREPINIFVRDVNIIEWQPKTKKITAKSAGATELYIVDATKMHIVPVRVAHPKNDPWKLTVPESLVSLDGLVYGKAAAAIYPDARKNSERVDRKAPGNEDDSEVEIDSENTPARLTVESSMIDVSKTIARDSARGARFSRRAETLGYAEGVIQVVDERSTHDAIYPVSRARVKIIGTEFSGETDNTGHLHLPDLPRKSRLMVSIDDPSGNFRPTMGEIIIGEGESAGLTRVSVAREFAVDALQRVAGSVQDTSLGSLCGTATYSAENPAPVPNVTISLDVRSEGPFYFNRFGFLDRSQAFTGPSGRFCFLNIEPGPVLATFATKEATVGIIPVNIFAGKHAESEIQLAQMINYSTHLVAIGTAHDQLSSDAARQTTITPIDMIDLMPLGDDRPFSMMNSGFVSTTEPLLSFQNRNLVVANSAEFETAIYAFESRHAREAQVVPLIPRGFVEDMAVFAQVSHDPSLGVVLVEHGDFGGQGSENIHFRLVNESGFDVGDGWYFSEAPVTKAIFFNVNPGQYQVIVETAAHYWLAADTVTVFSETVSYLATGSRIRYNTR